MKRWSARHSMVGAALLLFASVATTPAAARDGVMQSQEMVKTFLALVGKGYPEAAFAMMTPLGKKNATPDGIASFAATHQLNRMTGAKIKRLSMNSNSRANRETVIIVEIAREDIEPVDMRVTIHRVQDRWLVHGLFNAAATPATSSARPDLPNKRFIARLVDQSMAAFLQSVRASDMQTFHATTATALRKQIPVERFNIAFKDLFGSADQIAKYLTEPLVHDQAPRIDPNNQLVIAGRYPTSPQQLEVNATYVVEDGVWKPIGFRLKILAQQ